MKKFSKKAVWSFGVAVVLIVLCIIVYYAAPAFLYKAYYETERKNAGLQIKTVDIPDFKIAYAEGGTGEPLVLIHGFGGSMDNWINFAKAFTPRYRVIIPDLPGFGDSSKPKDKSYKIAAQVQRLDQFLKALKIDKANLVGNSVGGAICGTFAATYPGKVKTLALFDSGGVISPIMSKPEPILEKWNDPLAAKKVSDYDGLMQIIFHMPPQIPSMFKKYLTEQAAQAAPLNHKIYKELADTDMLALGGKLDKIHAPTLILWGDSDKIIHISTVDVLKKIKNSKVAIIKECGHMPMLEKPKETAAAYQEFIKGEK